MIALDKSRKELAIEHDRLCDEHDELVKKYRQRIKNKSFIQRSILKNKTFIEIKKLESKIDVLSEAIDSVEAKKRLFEGMPASNISAAKRTSNASSESIKKAVDSMQEVIKKEYKTLDTLVTKKELCKEFLTERRKGLKKYDFGPMPLLGAVISAWVLGAPASVLLEGIIIFSNLSFLLPVTIAGLFGAAVASVIKVVITNNRIKVFKELNSELGKDKLDLTSENPMQEVYDLNSQIYKKEHDIMVMETILKEQTRSYEEAKENERKQTKPSLSHQETYIEDYTRDDQIKLSLRK